MKITKEWLNEQSACREGKEWFSGQKETDAVKVLEKLLDEKHLDWANWTICRLFSHTQKIQYAIYAAEQVIDLYEKEYPDDKRPRAAIEAAKKYLENPSEENKEAAYAAYAAAYAAYAAANAAACAADAAYAAYAAANAANAAACAAYAAYAAANAADAAAYAAAYAAYAAANAANAANAAACAAYAVMKTKILKYGIGLLNGRNDE